MDKELQQALAAIISKTTHAAEAGAAFLKAELPDVIRQLLVWKASEAAIMAVVLLAIAGVIFYGSWQVHKWIQADPCKYGFNDRATAYIAVAFCGLIGFACLLTTFGKVATVVQISVAPKIYLIEYAASLVQGAAK